LLLYISNDIFECGSSTASVVIIPVLILLLAKERSIVCCSFKKPTILVVDDMTITLLLIHDLLKDTYEVKIAKSGTKALEILESPNDIDLILLDIEMPDTSNYLIQRQD